MKIITSFSVGCKVDRVVWLFEKSPFFSTNLMFLQVNGTNFGVLRPFLKRGRYILGKR